MLQTSERLDDLIGTGLKIIQSDEVFSFSIDAVLLANFTYVPIQKGLIVDLCAGNGAVGLMLSKRSRANIVGVEIQERLYTMANRSIHYNHLEHQVSIVHADLKQLPSEFRSDTVDVITCNPPYFPLSEQSIKNPNEHLAIARHEIACSLEDVLSVSSRLLKQGGKIAMVHRPNRLIDIVTLMRKHRLEPKRIQFVYPKMGREANILLIEAIKDGKPDVKILPELYIYEEDGSYTAPIQAMLRSEG